jgi:RimJ/RimL family protein N-acetyltransferase
MQPFELRTTRLVLNQPGPDDIDAIAEYCTDAAFEKYLPTPWPYTREHAVDFVSAFVPAGWHDGSEATWAVRLQDDGPLIGMIAIRLQRHDVGFWLGAEHRGFGYMPEAVSAVSDWVFDGGIPDAPAVLWEAVIGNIASARVARKSGFRYSGIAPATAPGRDGTVPQSWHASLAPGIRSVHHGWPQEVVDA